MGREIRDRWVQLCPNRQVQVARGRARTITGATAKSFVLVSYHSPCVLSLLFLSTMDDDNNTTYINNTSSITFNNHTINGPDHHHHQIPSSHYSPPTSSISNNPSSPTSSTLTAHTTATTTTTSYSRPNMEEVWNDLNLVPLNEVLSLNNNNNPPNPASFAVHDFLGRSINRSPQCGENGETTSSSFGSHIHDQMQQQQQRQPRHPLGSALNLNSSPGLEFLVDNFDPLVMCSNSDHRHRHHQIMRIQSNPMSSVRVAPNGDHRIMNDNDNSSPFQALASATQLTTFGRKRFHENAAERRHKRKMKNRESAARSRARREAYTNELELELGHLLAENAKLKRQHEQLLSVVDAQVARRYVLQRASTAPF